jgi:uncharacterized protein (TIGR03437 family)
MAAATRLCSRGAVRGPFAMITPTCEIVRTSSSAPGATAFGSPVRPVQLAVNVFLRPHIPGVTYAGIVPGLIGVYPLKYVIPLTSRSGFKVPAAVHRGAATPARSEIAFF